jgi:hypothetical protein
MPNNSKARRDKNETKSRRRESPPLDKQVPSESVESFLSRSSANSEFQGDDDELKWESVVEEAALDNSLSSSSRLPSSAAPKETRKEERRRKRKEDLEKELEDESDITLSDDSSDKEDSAQRKISLSLTQFLESKATGPLNGSRAMQQRAMARLSALNNAPIQVIESKGEEDAVDIPVEAVASVIASGANSFQRDNQGLP